MGHYRPHYIHCKVCETTFRAIRRDARYCSPKCRQAINRAIKQQEADEIARKVLRKITERIPPTS